MGSTATSRKPAGGVAAQGVRAQHRPRPRRGALRGTIGHPGGQTEKDARGRGSARGRRRGARPGRARPPLRHRAAPGARTRPPPRRGTRDRAARRLRRTGACGRSSAAGRARRPGRTRWRQGSCAPSDPTGRGERRLPMPTPVCSPRARVSGRGDRPPARPEGEPPQTPTGRRRWRGEPEREREEARRCACSRPRSGANWRRCRS